jgi:RHS repeat-associated protein
LGSTRLLMDGLGLVLNSYGYEAFGETVSQTGTTGNKYQYAGEQLDGTLGDYYLRQRFYDTSSGRFGRMDTYEEGAGNLDNLNKYLYADSNPINFRDPSGYLTMGDALATLALISILAVNIVQVIEQSLGTVGRAELQFTDVDLEDVPSWEQMKQSKRAAAEGVIKRAVNFVNFVHGIVVIRGGSSATAYEAGPKSRNAPYGSLHGKD